MIQFYDLSSSNRCLLILFAIGNILDGAGFFAGDDILVVP